MKKILRSWVTLYLCVIALMWCVYHPIYKTAATITATTETVASQLITSQSDWEALGIFLAAGAESNDLIAGSQRTQSGVQTAIAANANGQGKIIIYGPLPIAANGIRIRNVGVADASDHVYNVYSGTLGDHNFAYVLRGTLSFVCGTQLSDIGATLFADTLVVTNAGASSSFWTVMSPENNTVAEALIDLQGDNMLVIVPTTLDDNSQLLGKIY